MRKMQLVFVAVTLIGLFDGVVFAVQGNWLGAGIMWVAAIVYAGLAARIVKARQNNADNNKNDKR